MANACFYKFLLLIRYAFLLYNSLIWILTLKIQAVFIAFAHLALFKFLDGKRADGRTEIAPQSHINSLSHLLASLFQTAIQACLSAVFIQYLWFVLRRSALNVSTIETLFLIRSQPLSFFRFELSALKSTSILLLIASLIWAVYIVTIFPPGALTIGQVPYHNSSLSTVPIFNASFVCHDSFLDFTTWYWTNSILTDGKWFDIWRTKIYAGYDYRV